MTSHKCKKISLDQKKFWNLIFYFRDRTNSQLSVRSTKSAVTVVNPDEDLEGNKETKTSEETANNLEEKLEPDEETEGNEEKDNEANEDSNDTPKEQAV